MLIKAKLWNCARRSIHACAAFYTAFRPERIPYISNKF